MLGNCASLANSLNKLLYNDKLKTHLNLLVLKYNLVNLILLMALPYYNMYFRKEIFQFMTTN